MIRQCVYFPADNAEGYIWESILPHEIDAFLSQGWSLTPEFKEDAKKVSDEEMPYSLRKRGRPRKEV